jgi:eukaryotic-like serine/threonine-protein kinase
MRPKAWAALALLVSLALPLLTAAAQDGPDWPMYRSDAQHTGSTGSGVPAALEAPLSVNLSRSALTPPVASGGRIFTCSADGTIFSVWADNGAVAWSRPLGQNVSAVPAVDGDTVYALTEPGLLRAFDAARGHPLWNASLPAGLDYTLPLTLSNGSLLVSTASGAVLRLSAAEHGRVMWQTYLNGGLKGPVTVGGGLVYVVMAGGNTTALDIETGKQAWYTGPGKGTGNDFPSAYVQGRLYIASRDREVFCMDTSNGSLVWSRSFKSSVSGAPALGEGRIVLGTANGQVYAIDIRTGNNSWDYPFDAGGGANVAPLLAPGTVVLGDEKGALYLLDAATGKLQSNITLSGRRFSPPVASEGRILLASSDGALFILGPASAAPSAALEISPARASTGEEVVFTALDFSSPSVQAFGGMQVDFGDGELSVWTSGTRLVHAYAAKGTYEAALTARDSAGAVSHPVYGRVEVFNERPSAAVTLPSSARAGEPAALDAAASDPDGRIVGYEWDFEGDGTFDWSGPEIPTGFNHTYAVNGTYHPAVRVMDDNGSSVVATGTLAVLPAAARPPAAPPAAPLSLPAAAASVSLVSLAAAGACLSLTDFGKYRFFTLFIVPLYVRLKHDEVLDNYTRGKIHGYIIANPGDNYNSIRDALELSNGIVAHHLHTLEREGLVQSMRDGMYRRFFPANAKLPPEDEGHFNIQKRIVAVIRDNPGISQKEIAQKVGVSSPTVNYHVSVLSTARMIRVEKFGRRTRCFVIEQQPHT